MDLSHCYSNCETWLNSCRDICVYRQLEQFRHFAVVRLFTTIQDNATWPCNDEYPIRDSVELNRCSRRALHPANNHSGHRVTAVRC